MSDLVLVVDDNEELAEDVGEILRGEGLEVVLAKTADEAEHEARARAFDLAIVDIRLAGNVSGLELIPRLRRASLHGEIVVLTGNASLDTAILAIRSGVYAYLQKPFPPEELLMLVKRALAQVALKKDKQALTLRLEASEALHREIFETVEAAIFGLDERANIHFANRFGAERLGLSAHDLLGRSLTSLCCSERDASELERAIARVLRGAAVRDLEVSLNGESGAARHVRWTLSRLDTDRLGQRGRGLDVEGSLVLACGIDITERLVLEKKQAESEAVAAMGTLTTGLAHEIRNPLNAARLQLEILLRRTRKVSDADLGRALGEPAELVREELGRLTSLLDDFLHLARPREVVRRPVRVRELLEGVHKLEEPLASEAGVKLRVHVEPGDLEVRGDHDKLKQVLINLVGNAIDALRTTGAMGQVEVTATAAPGGGATIEVADNGPGIAAGLTDPFAPFVTNKQGGTGLGLAIVRKIVQQHGGEARLLSRPSGGTVARFTVGA